MAVVLSKPVRSTGLASLLIMSALLAGCVSYEPRQLVPTITLSAEDIALNQPAASATGGVDFGLTVSINESDSLFNVEVLPGVRVRQVNPGSPAELAGLQAGDVILSINGTEVNQPDTFDALAQQGDAAAPYSFRVRRGTAVLEASLIARARAAGGAPLRELFRSDPLATRAGYETAVLQLRDRGEVTAARVVEIASDSPLRNAGVQIGDLVLTAGDEPVESAQGFINLVYRDYELGDQVPVSLYRDNQILTRTIRLWDPGRRVSRIALRPLMFYESNLANQQTRFSLFDFWIFSVYSYQRSASEREHRLLELFGVSSDFGELVEEPTR